MNGSSDWQQMRQQAEIPYLSQRDSVVRLFHDEPRMVELDNITGAIVDASLKIHRDLGPGLLESVYEVVLAQSLEAQGLNVKRHVAVDFEYRGMTFHEGFRVDLLVAHRVVVELKSVEHLAPVHYKQLLTYLRLLRLPVGLLINFGAPTLKEGLHRVVNNLTPTDSPRLRVNQLK